MDRFRSLCTALGIVLVALAAPASAAAVDRNEDGLPDKWEKRYGLSLTVKQGGRDQDRDGLRNRDEYRRHTNPRYRDTDNDSLRDGDELWTGHDPLDRDSDDDGVEDGRENPGRIVTFVDGVVTLELSGSERVRALVNEATAISCEGPTTEGRADADAGKADGDVAGGDRVLARTDYGPDEAADDGPVADIGDPPSGGCGPGDLRAGAIVREAALRSAEDGSLTADSIALLRAP
jgi:hypothetical protein